MSRWLRLSGPVFWIVAVQSAWTVALLLWIIYFVDRNDRPPSQGWGVFVAGILLFALMQLGVIAFIIHFGKQVAHNRAMKDFVSRVSHDLRSPLASVKLHLQTLELRELDAEQRRACLAAGLQELARLESGIEDVLTASRLERQSLLLVRERVELSAFLEAYAQSKEPEVALHGASLAWKAASPLEVRADLRILRQMLDNLVDNAVVHGPKGVHVGVELVEQAGCAVIGVRDDGPGLEDKERKLVFRMFYRTPNSRSQKGTGLGLFIVAGIAKAHGGRAWVDTAGKGKGCLFRVALPLAREEAT